MGAVIANLGYLSKMEFVVKFVLPIMATCFVFAGGLYYYMTLNPDSLIIPSYVPYLIVVLGIGFVLLYPYISFEKKKLILTIICIIL
jgi:hypothetical protein